MDNMYVHDQQTNTIYKPTTDHEPNTINLTTPNNTRIKQLTTNTFQNQLNNTLTPIIKILTK